MNSFFILKLIVPGCCGRHILIDVCRHIITTLLFTVIPLNDLLYYPAWGGVIAILSWYSLMSARATISGESRLLGGKGLSVSDMI